MILAAHKLEELGGPQNCHSAVIENHSFRITKWKKLLWQFCNLISKTFSGIKFSKFKSDSFIHDYKMSNTCFSEAGTSKKLTVMERIFNICKTYALSKDSCAEASAYLASKFFTR